MLEIINKVWKNKVFLIILLLILITLPTTIYKQSDKDKTIVTSSIGIDLKDNEYDVTILAVIPKGENNVNSNLEVFNDQGSTLSEALDNISFNIGRKIGLAHCDCIIFNESLMNENLTQILDYFIRTANLSTNPSLIATPDSAKDLLDAVKSSNNLLDLSLKNIITSQEDRTLLENTTIDRFYRAYYSPNSTFTIPVLSVKKSDDSKGQGSSEGNMSSDSSASGSESGASQSSEDKKIENKNEVIVLKDGRAIGKLSDDEKYIYSLLSKPSAYQKFTLENINDENFTNSTVVFQETDKAFVVKYKMNDNNPEAEFHLWLSVMLDEVKSIDNHDYSSINGTENYLTDTIKAEFEKQVAEKLENTNKALQENKYDVLNLYAKFNAFRHGQFMDYIESVGGIKEYMSKMTISIKLHLNYVI